jgi:serine/threonine protein kinase
MIIDKYVVYNLIGEGSNGQVYKGMDDQSKKQVAIKVMNLKAIRNEQNTLIKEIKERLCES